MVCAHVAQIALEVRPPSWYRLPHHLKANKIRVGGYLGNGQFLCISAQLKTFKISYEVYTLFSNSVNSWSSLPVYMKSWLRCRFHWLSARQFLPYPSASPQQLEFKSRRHGSELLLSLSGLLQCHCLLQRFHRRCQRVHGLYRFGTLFFFSPEDTMRFEHLTLFTVAWRCPRA